MRIYAYVHIIDFFIKRTKQFTFSMPTVRFKLLSARDRGLLIKTKILSCFPWRVVAEAL